VGIRVGEKGCEDREERRVLGSEERRRDERDDYRKEVECCWEDVTLV